MTEIALAIYGIVGQGEEKRKYLFLLYSETGE